MYEVIRWTTLVILWACIALNLACVVRGNKVYKDQVAALRNIREIARQAADLRNEYEQKLAELESEVSGEG